MPQIFVCALVIISSVCCAHAEGNEFAASPEFAKKQPPEAKLFANNMRDKNSSKIMHLKSNNYSAYDSNSFDKQPRTVNHRLEPQAEDKSNNIKKSPSIFELLWNKNLKRASSSCCGSSRGSNPSRRPDSYYDKIPFYSSRYPTKFGDRSPIDRYGWHTQGQSPGLNGGSGTLGGGSYSETAFYEGSRGGYRPSFASGSRKPGSYDSDSFGGYGYAAGGQGGYNNFARPTGSAGSGDYGISGTLANGDEFGQVGPYYPEENVPSRSKIQAQKAIALKALAGVALLGAAAALAANPVLLPLGIVSGRRKRSNLLTDDKDAYIDYASSILKSNVIKEHPLPSV